MNGLLVCVCFYFPSFFFSSVCSTSIVSFMKGLEVLLLVLKCVNANSAWVRWCFLYACVGSQLGRLLGINTSTDGTINIFCRITPYSFRSQRMVFGIQTIQINLCTIVYFIGLVSCFFVSLWIYKYSNLRFEITEWCKCLLK